MPRFVTKKWVEVHHQSGDLENSKPSKPIRFKTSVLRSDRCDFSDAYIVVEGKIAVIKRDSIMSDEKLAFKNKAPFVCCILKIDNAEDLDVVMPMRNLLKYSKNYSKTTDVPLINCEINLILTWSEDCVLTSKATRNAVPAQGGNPAVSKISRPTNAIFQITEAKLYVPVVTLSTENDKKLLGQLRTGFRRTIKWDKYRLEMTNQTKNKT